MLKTSCPRVGLWLGFSMPSLAAAALMGTPKPANLGAKGQMAAHSWWATGSQGK